MKELEEPLGILDELCRYRAVEYFDRQRVGAADHHLFSLRLELEFSKERVLAGYGIPRKDDAAQAPLIEVSKDNLLDRYRCPHRGVGRDRLRVKTCGGGSPRVVDKAYAGAQLRVRIGQKGGSKSSDERKFEIVHLLFTEARGTATNRLVQPISFPWRLHPER